MPRTRLPSLATSTTPFAEHLATARATLHEAAPAAALLLKSAITEPVEKEQLDAARDVLDRVGVRKDVPVASGGDHEASRLAVETVRVLFEALGVRMPDPPVAVESHLVTEEEKNAALEPSGEVGSSVSDDQEPKTSAALLSPPAKASRSAHDEAFLLSLEEDGA